MATAIVAFDLDGVIFPGRNFWLELHEVLGTLEQGKALTGRLLHTDYERLVEEVVGRLWKGKDATPYYRLIQQRQYVKGARETFARIHERGLASAIISSSALDLAYRVQADFGVQYVFANHLAVRNGRITGDFVSTVGSGGPKKAELLRRLCSSLGLGPSRAAYVGDDDSDLDAVRIAGCSIAFNSVSARLRREATYVVDSDDLCDIISVL